MMDIPPVMHSNRSACTPDNKINIKHSELNTYVDP